MRDERAGSLGQFPAAAGTGGRQPQPSDLRDSGGLGQGDAARDLRAPPPGGEATQDTRNKDQSTT